MTNNAVLYTRVSSDEQRKSGFSLDYQEKQGREYAIKNNLQIVKVYTESFTAKKPGRPKFNEMLAYVRKYKIQHLIFLKSDRAARNSVDSATLTYMAERETFNIHLIQDGLCLNKKSRPTDFLIFEINNTFANFYPRNLSVEVTTKLIEKAEQGYYPIHAPIGYTNKRFSHRSYLQINPEKAPFIRKIFELYATGEYSYRTLASKMREEGFMISPAVKCGKSNIEDILNNPIYMGDFVYKGKRYYNGKHEPIVSRELYSICQKIIQERTKGKNSKHDFVYSNLIKCSKCGCYMVGEIKKGKYIYYHCTGNKGGNCKKSSYIRQEEIDKAVFALLDKCRISSETLELAKRCFKNELKNQNLYNEERLVAVDAEIKKLKERSEKLFNLYLDDKVSEEIYKKKSAEIESLLDDLILSQSAMTKTGTELLHYSENLFELFKIIAGLYSWTSNQKKREMLKLLCSNFSYDGENIEIAIKKAFQPLVEIAKLEKVGMKRQCSNFSFCIKELVKIMQEPDNLLFLEKFKIFKSEFLAA